MKNLFEEIKNQKLNPDEQAEILRSLHSFVAAHPVKRIPSPFWRSSSFFNAKAIAIMASLVFVFATTFGTAFASNKSLPGDLLYPIKILRENIQAIVAVGPKANAEVDAQHAVARLKEAEQLSSEGRLDLETKKQIENTFVAQTNNALKHIDELKNEGKATEAEKVSLNFQVSLADHQKVISEIRDGGDDKAEAKSQQENNVVVKVEEHDKPQSTQNSRRGREGRRAFTGAGTLLQGSTTTATSTIRSSHRDDETATSTQKSFATTTIPVIIEVGNKENQTEIRSSVESTTATSTSSTATSTRRTETEHSDTGDRERD